jgi:Protein of unknown function (DUF4197)
VQRNLQQIGFYQQYQSMLTTYKQLPLANKPDLELEQHVLTQSLNALFTQVGEEEKAIRKDPLGRVAVQSRQCSEGDRSNHKKERNLSVLSCFRPFCGYSNLLSLGPGLPSDHAPGMTRARRVTS